MISVAVLILVIAIFQFRGMSKIGIMKWYCLQVLVIAVLFVFMWYFFPNRVFHLHHYTIAIILQTFCCN